MKKDIFLSVFLGALAALFTFLISLNIKLPLPFNLGLLFLVLPFLAVLGVLLGKSLKRVNEAFYQFIKFAEAGALSTSIDFGVFNVLILLTGTTKGVGIIFIAAAGFTAAVINSYLWNKFWTFKKSDTGGAWVEFMQFVVVSLVGLGINSGIVFGITTFIPPFGDITPEVWANIGKVVAIAAALVWNFLGYKFIVFKEDESSPSGDYIKKDGQSKNTL